MTDRMLTCAACGYTGYDVATKIVKSDGTREVRIKGGSPGEVYTVPEKFAAEPRCVDRYACRDRQERETA